MDAKSHPQKGLGRHLLRRFVLEVPDAVAVRERLEVHAAFRLDADLEAPHVEQEIGIVLRIHRPAFARA